MSGISVGRAHASEAPKILEFIRAQWKSDHIFVLAQETFMWQYLNGENLNAFVARSDNNDILGFLGYIPFRQYDENIEENCIMLALWKTHETLAPPGLGLRLFKTLQSQINPDIIGAIGISQYVKPIYEMFGYTTSQMKQVALFNPNFAKKSIIASSVPEKAYQQNLVDIENYKLGLVTSNDWLDSEFTTKIDNIGRSLTPARSLDYVTNRYVSHPWYTYKFIKITKRDQLETLLICRRLEVNGRAILRIMDIIGYNEALNNVSRQMVDLLKSENVEYIDLMYWSEADCNLGLSGFVGTEEFPNIIIPNYFSPFVQSNVTVDLAIKKTKELRDPESKKIVLYKAHSDQDRPNVLSELEK